MQLILEISQQEAFSYFRNDINIVTNLAWASYFEQPAIASIPECDTAKIATIFKLVEYTI